MGFTAIRTTMSWPLKCRPECRPHGLTKLWLAVAHAISSAFCSPESRLARRRRLHALHRIDAHHRPARSWSSLPYRCAPARRHPMPSLYNRTAETPPCGPIKIVPLRRSLTRPAKEGVVVNLGPVPVLYSTLSEPICKRPNGDAQMTFRATAPAATRAAPAPRASPPR